MRVLHIISGDLWAGAEVQAFTLLTALQNEPGMTVAAAVMNEGELAKRLRERHIQVIVLPEARLSSLKLLSDLRRLIRDWTPDIVHTHRIKENILGSIANGLSRRAPSVRTEHGASEHTAHGLRRLRHYFLLRLDTWCGVYLQQRVIAVTEDLAELLTVRFSRSKVVVIENGVDMEAVRCQVRTVDFRRASPLAVHVGFVGRLVPVKRADLFIKTAAMLGRMAPGIAWQFHVFGDGPLLIELEDCARREEVSRSMTFHGHRSDIASCIAGLDVMVMCSDHEGMPMAILEAMAVGTPIVAHAVGGLARALEGLRSATLVRGHTPEDYAVAVRSTVELALPRTLSGIPLELTSAGNATRVVGLYADMLNFAQHH